MATSRQPPRGVYPTEEEIAERVYEMFLDRLSSADMPADYWDRAETELLERAVIRAIHPETKHRRRRRR